MTSYDYYFNADIKAFYGNKTRAFVLSEVKIPRSLETN